MARFIIASSLLLVVLVAAAAVEARDVVTLTDAAEANATTTTDPQLDGTSDDDNGRMLTAVGVATTCDQVRFPRMCQRLVRRTPGLASARDLLLASLRVATAKAAAAKVTFDLAMKTSHAERPMSSILETCRDGYVSVLESLKATQQIIDAHGTHTDLINKLTDAGTFGTLCQDTFGERPNIPVMFPAMMKNVDRVISSTLAIAANTEQL